MDAIKDKQDWQKARYGKKFSNAFRGICVFVETTRNSHLGIYAFAILVVVFLGSYLKISSIEWVLVVFAIGFVIITEAINTAIEIDMNLTSPEYHPHARDTKDVAAGAVLLASFTAAIVGLIIFLPKIF